MLVMAWNCYDLVTKKSLKNAESRIGMCNALFSSMLKKWFSFVSIFFAYTRVEKRQLDISSFDFNLFLFY